MICLLLYHIPCVADSSWSLDFELLSCYHLPLLQTVSCMLSFNTCISLDNCVITWPPGMPLFGKTLMLYHDLPRLLSILWYVWLLAKYHHLVMLSLYTQHDIFDLWLSSLREPWLVILYHDRWPVFLLYMQWPDYIALLYSLFLIMSNSCFSRKVIIKLLHLKMDQLVLGRGKYADIDMCSCLQWY